MNPLNSEKSLETRGLSALAKVFADEELTEPAWSKASALWNESFSFQVAYRSTQHMRSIRILVESKLKELISVRTVGLVPAELPCHSDHDPYILRATPGLFPDPLYVIDSIEGLTALPGQWRTLWIEVNLNSTAVAGTHSIQIGFETESGQPTFLDSIS